MFLVYKSDPDVLYVNNRQQQNHGITQSGADETLHIPAQHNLLGSYANVLWIIS